MKSRFLDEKELEELKKAMPEELWLPFALCLETGLRVGDIAKIKAKDIQPDGVHYRAEKTKKDGIAPISAHLRAELPHRNGYIFPGRKARTHITRSALWYRVKKACERASMPALGVSPHSFRKSFAVELYREKGFRAVQQALQHSNAPTTEIYAFADWSTGENANRPLLRKDLQLIVKMCMDALSGTK